MKHKDIKRIINKQLKSKYPNWSKLTKKEKKRAAKEITTQVIEGYEQPKEIQTPLAELVGIEEQVDLDGVISLIEMGKRIQAGNHPDQPRAAKLRVNLKNPLLKFIDDILDDRILCELLHYKGFTKSKRIFFPVQFFRAELLKAIKYPEISYRKFASEEYMGMERKENKEFLGLPLHKKQMISHSRLSQFRSSLSFTQVTNLLVYILYHVKESGILDNCLIHGVDSTELANENKYPLFKINVGGKKIKIYSDLDADCGVRRNKRNKSKFFVGYRMHTLTAIDKQTGHSFPLASIIAAGNHHDSIFLEPLVQLGLSMGIDMKFITADEAYHDNEGKIYKDTEVTLITPPSKSTKLPDNVEAQSNSVFCDDECEIPMNHVGCFENGHEYQCSAELGECNRAEYCQKYRTIFPDNGEFQRILPSNDYARQATEIRKNIERPFNLLKHREGLETLRVRSQSGVVVQCAFATMANLFIEVERRCNDREKNNPQQNYMDMAS